VPFATAFGITLPFARNEWRQTPVRLGVSNGRADSGQLVTAETARKREWEATTIVGAQDEREAIRRLLEGDGLHVEFNDASGFSWHGIGPSTATSVTYSVSGGKRSGRVSVGAGGVLRYALANLMREPDGVAWAATKGWTVAVFKVLSVGDGGDGTTYVDHLATGSVAVVRGASANPVGVTQYKSGVAGSWSMGNWLEVSAAGEVAIHGYTNAGATGAYDFDELLVLPFALPSTVMATWAAALATFRSTTSMGRLPRVLLDGDCIPDAAPLAVRCELTRSALEQMAFDGSWKSNSTRDTYTLRQV
jgi:hypothetical protein